jgi:hypothetical protein
VRFKLRHWWWDYVEFIFYSTPSVRMYYGVARLDEESRKIIWDRAWKAYLDREPKR